MAEASALDRPVPVPPPVIWRAASCARVAHIVSAPTRRSRVLAAFPTCLYLATGRHEEVLAVLTRDAIDLPIGVRLAVTADELGEQGGWGTRAGDAALVGEGRVVFPAAEVVVTRTRTSTGHQLSGSRTTPHPRPHIAVPSTGHHLQAGEDLTQDRLRAASAGLARTALLGRDVNPEVAALIGRGRGLTPSGDDTVCGVLLALRATGHLEAHGRIATAVRSRLDSTTSLSAALLQAAADGWAVPDVIRLVTRLTCTPGAAEERLLDDLDTAGDPDVRAVLAIGHSSGADLLAGVAGVLDLLGPTQDPAQDPDQYDPQGAPRG